MQTQDADDPPPFEDLWYYGQMTPEILNGALFYSIEYLFGAGNLQEQSSGGARHADGAAGSEQSEDGLIRFVSEKFADDPALARHASLRIAALWRLLAQDPELLRLAASASAEDGMISEAAIIAAAELPLRAPADPRGRPRFDPDEFAAALRMSASRSG